MQRINEKLGEQLENPKNEIWFLRKEMKEKNSL